MTGRTLIVELHRWRGLKRSGGPLGTVLTVGWVSVSYLPFLLSAWLRARVQSIRGAISERSFVEMACAGEDPDQRRTNYPSHRIVPKGRT